MTIPRLLLGLGIVAATAVLLALPDLLRSDQVSVAPIEIRRDESPKRDASTADPHARPRKPARRHASSSEGEASEGDATPAATGPTAPEGGAQSPSSASSPSPSPAPAPTPAPAPLPDDDHEIDDDFDDDSGDDGDDDD